MDKSVDEDGRLSKISAKAVPFLLGGEKEGKETESIVRNPGKRKAAAPR